MNPPLHDNRLARPGCADVEPLPVVLLRIPGTIMLVLIPLCDHCCSSRKACDHKLNGGFRHALVAK
jgi:hypothetical protein